MATHFISDLHLQASRPGIGGLLLSYLMGPARTAEALYVLGDLFEYWLGDDASMPDNREVIDAFAALADSGTPLYYLHGNRDFLIGEAFGKASGAQILPDPYVLDLYGTRTILMHGDTLCTDDRGYQAFRQQVRDPENQRKFLALPIDQRRQIAGALRQSSVDEQADKSMQIMDVNADAVASVMREHAVRRLVHGHTHRPADHRWQWSGEPAQRIVLSDWSEERGNFLELRDDHCELHYFSDAD